MLSFPCPASPKPNFFRMLNEQCIAVLNYPFLTNIISQRILADVAYSPTPVPGGGGSLLFWESHITLCVASFCTSQQHMFPRVSFQPRRVPNTTPRLFTKHGPKPLASSNMKSEGSGNIGRPRPRPKAQSSTDKTSRSLISAEGSSVNRKPKSSILLRKPNPIQQSQCLLAHPPRNIEFPSLYTSYPECFHLSPIEMMFFHLVCRRTCISREVDFATNEAPRV